MEQQRHAVPEQEPAMTVTVNGDRRTLPGGCTVADLVERLGLAQRACAVEVDRTLVPRRSHAATVIRPGAAIEIVTLVGGG